MNESWLPDLDFRKCIADYTFVRLSAVVFVRPRSVSEHVGASFRLGSEVCRLYSSITNCLVRLPWPTTDVRVPSVGCTASSG